MCQEFINKSNPMVIIGSEIFKRNDSNELNEVLKTFNFFLKKTHNNKLNISILSTSLNETGVNYVRNFKSLTLTDVSNSLGMYFLNINKISSNFKKILELKLLKYSKIECSSPKILIEQNGGFTNKLLQKNLNTMNCSTYLNLPNNVFFESSNTYLTTKGILKKNIKFLSSIKQSKEDWQIIRKLFSNSKNIKFLIIIIGTVI